MSLVTPRLTLATALVSAVGWTVWLGPAAFAGTDPDLSSPKAAARSLYQAVEAEDGEAILKIFYAKDDSERELARAFADLIVAGKKLAEAAKNKFNATGEAFGGAVISKEDLAKMDQAQVSE